MTTDAIQRALHSHTARDDDERRDVARLRVALARADARERSSSLHITASALVVDRTSHRVLLRWHPRMAQWMQVGGHFDAGESDPWLVAVREAREETGLTDLRPFDGHGSQSPIQIVIVPVAAHGDEPAHEHADFRYLLETDSPSAIVPESPEAQLRWMSLPVAIAETTEENLRVYLRRVSELVDPSAG